MSRNRKATRKDRKGRKWKCTMSRSGKHIASARVHDGYAVFVGNICFVCGRIIHGPGIVRITNTYRYATWPFAMRGEV